MQEVLRCELVASEEQQQRASRGELVAGEEQQQRALRTEGITSTRRSMIRVDVANCKGDPRRNQQGIESEIIEGLSLSPNV